MPKLISLLSDTDSRIRSHAVLTLGEFRDPRAVEPLGRLLSKDNECLHGIVVDVLGEIGHPSAFQLLLGALKETASVEKREGIWHSIGDIGCADAVEHLYHLLENAGWSTKPEDARAMLEPSTKPVRKLPEKEILKIKADIQALASPDLKVSNAALTRLGRRRGQVVELLAEATANPNAIIRHLALHALESVGDPRTYPVILAMANDPIPDTRWCVYNILGKIGKTRAIPVLINVLQTCDLDSTERYGALEGLENVGEPAVPAVIELLENTTGKSRMGAASVLRGIGDARALPHIAKLMDDPDPQMRIAGQEEIAIMGENALQTLGHRCLDLIQPMLLDPEKEVRENAQHWFDELSEMLRSVEKSS